MKAESNGKMLRLTASTEEEVRMVKYWLTFFDLPTEKILSEHLDFRLEDVSEHRESGVLGTAYTEKELKKALKVCRDLLRHLKDKKKLSEIL